MRKKDLAQLRKKTLEELSVLVSQKGTQVAKLRQEILVGKTKNVHAAAGLRRELAQIKTIIREKELNEKISR